MLKSYLGAISLTGITILSSLVLSGSPILANNNGSVIDEINITVPVSCSLSGTGMDTHTAEITNGTYEANIGTTTLKAYCNDNNGFAIYTAGYTGNEIGGTNSNKLVGTSASNNATIETGTATNAGNPDTSNWAMKLAITSDSGDTTGANALAIDSDTEGAFSSFHTVPNEYTKVAHKNSTTSMDTTAGGVTLTTTYAAYISKTQIADIYSGQVIYTLVHPASASAPLTCNPNGTTIGTNASTDIKCMQDFASLPSSAKTTLIGNMTTGTQYTLTDKRDEKTYTIAKLADGKVWMTQNLDLDLDSGTTYTNLDTDLGWNGTNYSTASWTPIRSTYETTTNNVHQWCNGGIWNTQYGHCGNNNTPESYDPGDLYWNGVTSDFADWTTYYNSCDRSTNTPSCNESLNPLSTYVSSTATAQYHLGNYYNWAAAIASNDASSYGSYNELTDRYENREADQSICPVGWMLPYADQVSDFANLWAEYGWNNINNSFSNITNLTGVPLYFAPGGYFYGNLLYVGHNGYFWSSVVYDHDDARTAEFDVTSEANPSYNDFFRDNGFSLRCILR